MTIRSQITECLLRNPKRSGGAIARELGTSRSYVSVVRKELGLQAPNRIRRLPTPKWQPLHVAKVKTAVSEWTTDAQGNRCRIIQGVAA